MLVGDPLPGSADRAGPRSHGGSGATFSGVTSAATLRTSLADEKAAGGGKALCSLGGRRLESEGRARRRGSARAVHASFLTEGLSPRGADQAQALQGDHLSVSGDDANLFVYADSPTQAERAHSVILSELEHHGIVATTSGVEHWLAAEERWDNEPAGESWEEEATTLGYAPWEVRVTCGSRHEAIGLATQLEAEGYRPIRRWKHLIVGADTRADADALAARLHGGVEAGGAVVWEEAIDSDVVRPFAFFG